MIIQPIYVNQGDYGFSLGPWTLKDSNGNVVDLTDAVLSLKVQLANDTTKTDLTLAGSMHVDIATQGLCHYILGNGDFADPGTYNAQVVANYGSGMQIVGWPVFQIIVQAALPQTNN